MNARKCLQGPATAPRRQRVAPPFGDRPQDRLLPISDEAIALLVDVLRRPKSSRYEVVSSSRPDTNYELTVDGQDVVCSCPGFEYRGKCSHAGKLVSALASGGDLPSGMKHPRLRSSLNDLNDPLLSILREFGPGRYNFREISGDILVHTWYTLRLLKYVVILCTGCGVL
jgi:hypothetical protein